MHPSPIRLFQRLSAASLRGVALLAAFASTALAAPTGQIAYLSGTEQEDLRVCVIDIATAAVTPVGAGDRDTAPVWSPDGTQLAFTTRHEDGMAVQVVNADGTNRRMIAHALPVNYEPRWATSGKALTYSADDGGGLERTIMVYNLTTNEEKPWAQMAARPEYLRGFLRPVWLPSLKLMGALHPDQELAAEGVDFDTLIAEAFSEGALLAIALAAKSGGLTTEIYLITKTQAVPLLPFVAEDSPRYVEWAPAPAPNGERIAFESNDGGDREIFGLGRTGLHDLSNHFAADWNPVWSPDSEQLAFESNRGGRRGVYRLFADTARVMPVAVADSHDCWAPDWSPDGKALVYVSDKNGNPDLYIANANGEDVRQLTGGGGVAFAPAWRPVPEEDK